MRIAKERRKINWPTTIAIILFHVIALTVGPLTFNWANFTAFFVLYVISGLGITLGFHRYYTHNAFTTNNRIVQSCLAFMGSLALQGSVTGWVIDHFQHHNYSDQPEDPHSSREGFWWSHMGWLFYEVEVSNRQQALKDKMLRNPVTRFFDNKLVFLGVQFLVGFILLYIGGPGMVVWGIFCRVVFVWHITWFINSACHFWGFVTYKDSGDNSKNLWWMGLLAFGEGWHNNHHMYQASPRHGLKWWQIDATWYIIYTLSILRLAKYNPRLIPKDTI